MKTISLDGDDWTVHAVGDLSGVPEHIRGKVFPARVPGCVHLDLIRAGVLRHPNLGYAERDQEWVGRTDWRYERRLVVEPGPALPNGVSFGCLDTLATVELNGEQIGSAANSHNGHAFDASKALREGENLLAVTLRAPVPFVEREHARLGRLPFNGDEVGWLPFQMLRKPACNFGWDWGPRVATSGIAGPVALVFWAGPVGVHGTPLVRRESVSTWSVEVTQRGAAGVAGGPGLELQLMRAGVEVTGTTQLPTEVVGGEPEAERYRLIVEDPELWWPRGHGEQPTYELRCVLRLAAAESSSAMPIGFRTVDLDTSADEIGSAFALRINGEPVFCRGANWIPDALFPTEVTPERVRERVRQAADANMNMLRVWGGGHYEQDAFYQACDELGIMVWQDFPYACALYPDESRPPCDGAAVEAGGRIIELRGHPSIVLWCGGNECVEGYQHWGWKNRVPRGSGWGLTVWCRDLPLTVSKWDPETPFWPNSPWSGGPVAGERGRCKLHPEQVADVRDPDHGDRHTWDLHFEDVRTIVPRFVSEFGRIAPACERTLWEAGVFDVPDSLARGALCEAPPWDDATRAALEHRLRQTGGSKVAYGPVLPEHFREVATDLRGWIWQTQVLQARALVLHIEWLRANAPRCMGALLWQLNDCWACQSWAIIDHAGRPKPVWYAVRRAFGPRLLTIQPLGRDNKPRDPSHQGRGLSSPRAAELSAVLANDTDEPLDAPCRIRRETFDGRVLAESEAPIAAAARANGVLANLGALVGEPDEPAAEVLIAECDGRRALWFWDRDLRLHLPDQPLEAECVEHADGLVLRLHARSLAKDIIIAADLLGEGARVDDNAFTLLAGESREVPIRGTASAQGLPVAELVRCASGAAVAM